MLVQTGGIEIVLRELQTTSNTTTNVIQAYVKKDMWKKILLVIVEDLKYK